MDNTTKEIEEYIDSRDFTVTVKMASTIQVKEYEPRSLSIEISMAKGLEDSISDIYRRLGQWGEIKLRKWEASMESTKTTSAPTQATSAPVEAPRDVVKGAGDGGYCKNEVADGLCGEKRTVWKEGGENKEKGTKWDGFWGCPNFKDHK